MNGGDGYGKHDYDDDGGHDIFDGDVNVDVNDDKDDGDGEDRELIVGKLDHQQPQASAVADGDDAYQIKETQQTQQTKQRSEPKHHAQARQPRHEETAGAVSSLPLYSGVEPYLIGLAPTYWTHVPLLIEQIHHQIKFVDGIGIHCLLLPLVATQQQQQHHDPPTKQQQKQQKLDHDGGQTLSMNGNDEADDNDTTNNCGPNPRRRSIVYDNQQHHNATKNVAKFVPIQKCQLVGTVVSIDRRGSSSTNYVVDDGTGMVDCLCWGHASDDSLQLIPSSASQSSSVSMGGSNSTIMVGDTVRVMGHIEMVAIVSSSCMSYNFILVEDSNQNSDNLFSAAASAAAATPQQGNPTTVLHCRDCIYEIHVTIIDKVVISTSSSSSTTIFHPNVESRHWERCCYSYHTTTSFDSSCCTTAYNANDVLQRLGSDLQQQISVDTSIPSPVLRTTNDNGEYSIRNSNRRKQGINDDGAAMQYQHHHNNNNSIHDDPCGMWRLFGTNCTCSNNLTYKDALLYCHCHATVVPLDPHFVYRDALLLRLLDMEQEQTLHQNTKTSGGGHSSSTATIQQYTTTQTNGCITNTKSNGESSSNGNDGGNGVVVVDVPRNNRFRELRFQYQSIENDQALKNIAYQEILRHQRNNPPSSSSSAAAAFTTTAASSSVISTLQKQLIFSTFRALRDDGILYLLDEISDTYLLISRRRVLEPYCRRSLIKFSNKSQQQRRRRLVPTYLAHVPPQRIDIVRRSLLLPTTTQNPL